MYWRAYSLDKLNRQADALTSVAELLKGYPSSRWIADARALEIQVRQRAGQPVSPDVQADEELLCPHLHAGPVEPFRAGDLRQELGRPYDRAGDEVREEQDVQGIVERIADGP